MKTWQKISLVLVLLLAAVGIWYRWFRYELVSVLGDSTGATYIIKAGVASPFGSDEAFRRHGYSYANRREVSQQYLDQFKKGPLIV